MANNATQQSYASSSFILGVIGELIPGVYQEVIDNTWSNILRVYFGVNDFYVQPSRSLKKANVVVSNYLRTRPPGQDRLVQTRHKVLLVEAKRFPRSARHDSNWSVNYDWQRVLDQLGKYMRQARAEFGNLQTMYGIVAVGNKARFYQMNCSSTAGHMVTFNPNNPLGGGIQNRILDLTTNADIIHNYLSVIADHVAASRNRW
ncbi:hypothetical protein BGW36DRAFT_429860 [Talaromyces proteolyticus]|uniref:Uncharacterized protein n=1 Tax=Talaromyces proteolyticus TaxID=1131652 RepID=A0AAD4KL64_9EURO|nr:uncharacterized protein BGW36DRAFT_429860 [Talaromyces proteolyticus]KAH8693829.1 hypothetical protein BGW36DRAFT_429860 [Talaromyces proteolyticus]